MKSMKDVLKERSEAYSDLDATYVNCFVASTILLLFGGCCKSSKPVLKIVEATSLGVGMVLNAVSAYHIGRKGELNNIIEIEELINEEE